jgi:uncharacterized protein DUF992
MSGVAVDFTLFQENKMKKLVMALTAIGLLSMAGAPAAQAQADVRSGVLTCKVAPSVSFVIGSQKGLDCYFRSHNGRHEHYVGYITRFGVDLGFTTGGELAWAVFAPSQRVRGALAGTYAGASSEATIGVGVGANVLVGGFQGSVSLQPVSVTAQQGLSAAATVTGLELRPTRR